MTRQCKESVSLEYHRAEKKQNDAKQNKRTPRNDLPDSRNLKKVSKPSSIWICIHRGPLLVEVRQDEPQNRQN